MTRDNVQTILERRLKGEWTPAEMVVFINNASLAVGNLVTSINPNYFLRRRLQAVEAGVQYYPRPEESKHLIRVGMKSSTSTGWAPLEKLTEKIVRQRYSTITGQSSAGPVASWYLFGRYIAIDPAPSADLAQGLEILEAYEPTLSDGSASFPHPLSLHQAIFNRAHRQALPETAQFIELADALDKEYQQMTNDWVNGYFETAESIVIGVDDPGYDAGQ